MLQVVIWLHICKKVIGWNSRNLHQMMCSFYSVMHSHFGDQIALVYCSSEYFFLALSVQHPYHICLINPLHVSVTLRCFCKHLLRPRQTFFQTIFCIVCIRRMCWNKKICGSAEFFLLTDGVIEFSWPDWCGSSDELFFVVKAATISAIIKWGSVGFPTPQVGLLSLNANWQWNAIWSALHRPLVKNFSMLLVFWYHFSKFNAFLISTFCCVNAATTPYWCH